MPTGKRDVHQWHSFARCCRYGNAWNAPLHLWWTWTKYIDIEEHLKILYWRVIVRFTLPQNAISSLHISIENFKDFYYSDRAEKLSITERDEKIKIALVFLENSIELLLKSVLVTIDETCIYKEPRSRRIRNAQALVNDENTLADILIREANFKTIDYHETVRKYTELREQTTEKVKSVLFSLSYIRNAVTHFGIEIVDYGEIVLTFVNTFDVIYNYLYDDFIAIDSIGEYFTSDDFVVKTIHGNKWLVAEDGTYNNILDFLDELLIDHNDYIFALRANNPKTRISEFESLMSETITDKKFDWLLKAHSAEISLRVDDIVNKDFSFDIDIPKGSISVISRYSPYYNTTIFENDGGNILFLVVHNESAIYVYNNDVIYPCTTEPEKDRQWIEDESNGDCVKYNLSKRNLLKTFNDVFERYD